MSKPAIRPVGLARTKGVVIADAFSVTLRGSLQLVATRSSMSSRSKALTLTKSDPVILKIIDPPAARMFAGMGTGMFVVV